MRPLLSVSSPAMSACFMAIAACRARGDDVHPMHVRNIGFYQTWQRCAAQREDGAAQLSAADVLARLHLRFAENDDLVRNILLRHSPRNFSRDAIECDAMFTTAALMFWQRPNMVIELTPALERLLTSSDLGEDIPAAQLRPRMAACYIRFGEAMRQAVVLPVETGVHRIQGAYVFASTYNGKRAISIVAIYAADRDEPLGISSLDFVIEDEQESLLSVIRSQCGGTVESDSLLAQQTALAQLCTKVFLYWGIEQARHVSLTPHGDALRRLQGMGPRKAAKLLRQTERLYDRVVLGPDTLPAHLRSASGEMSPHWRRGHFRMQAHGPRLSLRKVMFISPTIVRADRLTSDELP
ncbi:hypothetical protein RCH05_002119 [Janthinobacterium sp. CAN_S7]